MSAGLSKMKKGLRRCVGVKQDLCVTKHGRENTRPVYPPLLYQKNKVQVKNKLGTNYYLEYNKCKKCGRSDTLHIGKSSAGWKFLFHKIPNKAESFPQWIFLLEKGTIRDEYDREYTFAEFLNLVRNKQGEQSQLYRDMELIDGYNFMTGEEWVKKLVAERKPLGPPPARKHGKSDARQF